MIQDVLIMPLKILPAYGGNVMHMIRCDSPFFKQFGEVYFSWVHPGCIKGWKKHLRQTQHFVAPVGKIKLVLFDDRKDSKTSQQIQEIEMGNHHYHLVRVPKDIWYSFKALGNEPAMIANCTDIPHDPSESIHREISDSLIPYSWNHPAL